MRPGGPISLLHRSDDHYLSPDNTQRMEDVDEHEGGEKRLPESDEEVFEINDFTNATPWERFDHEKAKPDFSL